MRLPAEEDFTSTLRSPAVAARVGVWLGVCFGLAFVTGLISHEAYVAHPFVPFPARPTWGYRVTQGVHVASGTAAIPLLLVKLWTVFPKLFTRPPRQLRELALDGLERASIAVLVAEAVFQLSTGLLNTAQWYPWGFHFRATHYAVAWVAIGALLVHIAVKLPLIRAVLGADIADSGHDRPGATVAGPLTRRALVRSAVLASGVAVLATAGSTVPALRKVSVLGVRSGDGPAGIPINKSAKAADVMAAALDPAYRLVVAYDAHEVSWSRADLERLEQRTVELPIACVEGWSANGRWTGVRVRDLLDLAGVPTGRDVRVVSLQPHGPFRTTILPGHFADDPLTLIALRLGGDALAIDHGFPCRLIAPDRPGVLQTKWVGRLEVVT
jgi:DMSO/TMAO reductase YedYZ molybdopterin-dependent catalytic subunit